MTCKLLPLIVVLFAAAVAARAADESAHDDSAPKPPANPQGPYEITWVTPWVESHNFQGEVIFSGDSKRLLVALDSEAQVWDTATWKPVGPRIHYGDWLYKVALDAAGKRVLVVRNVMAFPGSLEYVDAEWRVWDVEAGKAVGPAVRHEKTDAKNFPAKTAQMSPDGQWVAVYLGRTMELWRSDTGKRKHAFEIRESFDMFAADSKSFVVSDFDGHTSVWDIAAGEFRAVGATPLGEGYRFASSRRLIDTGFGFRVLDVRTGRDLLAKENNYDKYEVLETHISSSGNRVVVETGVKNKTQIWDVDSRKMIGSIPSVDVLTMDSRASTLLTYSPDQSTLWDADSGKKLRDFGEFIETAIFSRDGNMLAILMIVGNDRVVQVIRADPAKTGPERWMPEKRDLPDR